MSLLTLSSWESEKTGTLHRSSRRPTRKMMLKNKCFLSKTVPSRQSEEQPSPTKGFATLPPWVKYFYSSSVRERKKRWTVLSKAKGQRRFLFLSSLPDTFIQQLSPTLRSNYAHDHHSVRWNWRFSSQEVVPGLSEPDGPRL